MSEPSRIQFQEDAITPVDNRTATTPAAGGVYSLRQRASFVRSTKSTKSLDLERLDSEDDGELDERDIRRAQVFSGWQLIWLAYQATGVIYGDIGTSPLYVYSSTFSSDPSYDDLLGALSLIIWTLTLMVSVKYMFIVLRADDEGEGGTFALYSLLTRYANITDRDPREQQTVKMERIRTNELGLAGKTTRSFLEHSRVAKLILKLLGIFGVALVMADGVLTPAQSVLGAIQGLEVVDPSISNATIIGVSCAILAILFLLQPFGIARLASSFAPIVIIWLLFNFSFGIYNLVTYDASVLKAFSPYFAGAYLVRNRTDGWKSLGGILLAFTGVEALFADLGAFSRRAVQLSWLCFAFPCLLLAYIGQAAYISSNRSAWTNPFYNTVPPGMLYPSLVIAILAAIVASQAMITAAFQLLMQIMKLSYSPQFKMVHTSKRFHGQVYMPMANWLLMIGTLVVTGAYSNTTRLGHAYGVCVVLVTFITTSMVALVALIVWRLPVIVVIFFYLVFGSLDGVYLSSALTKVPSGAWFTLALAVILGSFFLLWRFGKEQLWKAEAEDRYPLSHLITKDEVNAGENTSRGSFHLGQAFGGHKLDTISGMGIFFDKTGLPSTTPTVFIHFLEKFHAAPELVVFFHLRPLHIPTVPADERFTVARCYASVSGTGEKRREVLPNCFRMIIRHGYMDAVVTEDLGLLVFDQIRKFVSRESLDDISNRRKGPADLIVKENGPDGTTTTAIDNPPVEKCLPGNGETISTRLAALQSAWNSQVVYVVGKEQMRLRHRQTNFARYLLLSAFLWIRENTRSKVQSLNVEVQKLVEIGFVKDIK